MKFRYDWVESINPRNDVAQTDTIIAPQTGAVATQVPRETINYAYVVIGADNLATTETVPLWILIGNTYKRVTDSTGANVALTSTVSAVVLDGGPVYAVTKDATAGSCGVYLIAESRRV